MINCIWLYFTKLIHSVITKTLENVIIFDKNGVQQVDYISSLFCKWSSWTIKQSVILKQVFKVTKRENSYNSLVSTFYFSLIGTSQEIVKTRTDKVKNIQIKYEWNTSIIQRWYVSWYNSYWDLYIRLLKLLSICCIMQYDIRLIGILFVLHLMTAHRYQFHNKLTGKKFYY